MAALWPDKEDEVPSNPHYALAKSVTLTNSNVTLKINSFHASLLHSCDRLFFIAHRVSDTSVNEWQLVQIAYEDTMQFHTNCLQYGNYLVDFYIMHLEAKDYYAINQWYWLEYHRNQDLHRSDHALSYHLLKPTKDIRLYAKSKGLYPYWKWVHMTHDDVFIHGPFDFVCTPKGHQGRDRIPLYLWISLRNKHNMYSNKAPSLSMVRKITIYCGTLFHTEVDSS